MQVDRREQSFPLLLSLFIARHTGGQQCASALNAVTQHCVLSFSVLSLQSLIFFLLQEHDTNFFLPISLLHSCSPFLSSSSILPCFLLPRPLFSCLYCFSCSLWTKGTIIHSPAIAPTKLKKETNVAFAFSCKYLSNTWTSLEYKSV